MTTIHPQTPLAGPRRTDAGQPQRAARVAPTAPTRSPEAPAGQGSPSAHLEAIADSAAALDQARYDLHAAVARARDAGASWAAIGRTLHVSRQAAWERFHRSSEKAQP